MERVFNILFVIGNIGFISLMLLPLNRLNFSEWFALSVILGCYHSKNVIDKTELENKIFEIKELLKK